MKELTTAPIDEGSSLTPPSRFPDTFWIIPIVTSLKDVSTFKKFLAHHNRRPDECFVGYRDVARRMMGRYLSSFTHDDFLGLQQDWKTHRAFFVGLDPEKMPPTCEKAIAYKNLHRIFTRIASSKNYADLEEALGEIEKIFTGPLRKVLYACGAIDRTKAPNVTLEDLTNYSARFWVWDIGHDLHRFEAAMTDSPTRLRQHPKTEKTILIGYAAGCGYLWSTLLGDTNAPIVKATLDATSWEKFDSLNARVRSECVDRMDREVGWDPILSDVFLVQAAAAKALFPDLLRPSGSPQLTLHDKIREAMIWHQFEVIDSGHHKIFSGASSVVSLLIGEIVVKRGNDNPDKVEILRFHHADDGWYSFGVLLERRTSISDYSGWLIFTKVGSPASGFANSELQEVEHALTRYAHDVNVTTSNVTLEDLTGFFKAEWTRKYGNRGRMREELAPTDYVRVRVRELESQASELLGVFLELAAKLYFEQIGFGEVHVSYDEATVLGTPMEIDIVAINESTKEALVAECTLSPTAHGDKSVAEEVARKATAMREPLSARGVERIRMAVVTTRHGLAKLRDRDRFLAELRTKKIDLLTLEQDILPRLPSRFGRLAAVRELRRAGEIVEDGRRSTQLVLIGKGDDPLM
ncbi:MAG: hypothetical protein HY556_03535 [Euryarchaeota archaeon]|nr:hypothetical protein [Euryarchaeota archaeon]